MNGIRKKVNKVIRRKCKLEIVLGCLGQDSKYCWRLQSKFIVDLHKRKTHNYPWLSLDDRTRHPPGWFVILLYSLSVQNRRMTIPPETYYLTVNLYTTDITNTEYGNGPYSLNVYLIKQTDKDTPWVLVIRPYNRMKESVYVFIFHHCKNAELKSFREKLFLETSRC